MSLLDSSAERYSCAIQQWLPIWLASSQAWHTRRLCAVHRCQVSATHLHDLPRTETRYLVQRIERTAVSSCVVKGTTVGVLALRSTTEAKLNNFFRLEPTFSLLDIRLNSNIVSRLGSWQCHVCMDSCGGCITG